MLGEAHIACLTGRFLRRCFYHGRYLRLLWGEIGRFSNALAVCVGRKAGNVGVLVNACAVSASFLYILLFLLLLKEVSSEVREKEDSVYQDIGEVVGGR